MSNAHSLPAAIESDELDVVPLRLDDFTPEQQAEIAESLANLAAGRARVVSREDVLQAIEEMRRRQGG